MPHEPQGRNHFAPERTESQAVVALSKKINATKFQKTLTSNDFYWGWKDYQYPIGNTQMLGKSMGLMFANDAPSFAPGWTLEMMAKLAVDSWLTTEDWPDPENGVTLGKMATANLRTLECPDFLYQCYESRG